jgi:hypothetical protein
MKLLYNSEVIGDITEVSAEDFWMNGRVELNQKGEELRDFFNFMTDERQGHVEPPFGSALLEPDAWHVLENRNARGIDVPAVHPDGVIFWRRR